MTDPNIKRLYGTAAWKRKRAQQLQDQPLCEDCTERGLVRSASVADHVEPHRGDVERFWNGKLQSLCTSCHSGQKQRIEKSGRARIASGDDGFPLDPDAWK